MAVRAGGCLPAIILLIGALMASTARGEQMLLEIKANGVVLPEAKVIDVEPSGPVISADLARQLHLRLPPEQQNERDIRLSDLPGVHWEIDQRLQQLVLTPQATALETTKIGFDATRPADVPNTLGAWFNYDLAATMSPRAPAASALTQVGGFTSFGAIQSDGVVTSAGQSTRLGTVFLRPSPSGESALRVGDSFLTGGALGQSFPFGGFQISSRDWFDPQQSRNAVQTILGQAATPSTLDVYVNDALQSRQTVPAGPFTLNNLPTVTGDGTVHVVVRDALGQERIIDRSFYSSPMILREGAFDWSFETGALRHDFGTRSFSYGEPFSAATTRQGALDWLSFEEHAEVSGRRQQSGAQASMQVFHLGAIRVGAAASRDASGLGASTLAGLESNHGPWTFGASAEIAHGQYTQLGYSGRRTQRQAGEARVGLDLGAIGAVNLSLVRSATLGQDPSDILAAGWTLGLGQLGQISASAYAKPDGKDAGLLLSLVIPLGPTATASTDVIRDTDGLHLRAQGVQAPPPEGGLGYRALAETGRNGREEAGATWRWSGGETTVDAGQFQGRPVGRATVSGGLAWLDGDAYLGQRNDGSFAVADVGTPGVRVYADKQPVGTTDSDGRVLIPRLRPFQNNQISIDPGDLPMDVSVGSTEATLVPRDRAGYVVKFETAHAALTSLVLVHPDGTFVDPGSRAVIKRNGEAQIVGYDGVFYAASLQPGDILDVEDGGRRCRVKLRSDIANSGQEKALCA